MEIRKLLLITLFPLSASAQQTFTEHLTRNVAGEGTVTLTQDAEIEALVNGVMSHASLPHKQQVQHINNADTLAVTTLAHRTQAIGFRIQIYAGGNNRQSKSEAYRMAGLARSYFPEVNVYTNFISPRWICRVGDFKTREEAVEQLRKMQLTQAFGEASIVKSKIIVTY